MGLILLAIALLVIGVLFIYLGYRELSKNSASFNILDTLGSLFLGNFETSGIGMVLAGLLFIIIGIVILL